MKEKIENLPLLVFLLVGVAVAGYSYMGSLSTNEGLEAQIAQLNSQLQEKNESLKKAQNVTSEVPMMKEEINNISQSLSKATELIPQNLSPRAVLDKISKQAKDAGVRVVSTSPSEIIPKNYFDELPITAEFEGSYAQLTLFTYLLSKEKIIIHPIDIELNTKEIVDNQSYLKMVGKLSGFRYKEVKQ